jgi:hypothetical protein
VSPTFLVIVEVIAALAIAGVVLFLLTRAARRYADSLQDDEVAEERDFVWSWAEFQSLVRDWLRRLWRRRAALRRPMMPTSPAPAAADPALPRDPRALYREVLRLGARLGQARAPSETPREYEQELVRLDSLSQGEAEIKTLTSVYAAARYGDAPPADEQVAAAIEALAKLRELTG